jgi:hypothetical protein
VGDIFLMWKRSWNEAIIYFERFERQKEVKYNLDGQIGNEEKKFKTEEVER